MPNQKGSSLLIGLIISLLVIGGLFGAYFISAKKNSTTPQSTAKPLINEEPLKLTTYPNPSLIASPPLSNSSKPAGKSAHMDTTVALVAQQAKDSGVEAAIREAQSRGASVTGSSIRVDIQLSTTDTKAAEESISAAGGKVETDSDHLVEALIPVDKLETIVNLPDVVYIRIPSEGIPL